MKRHMRSVVAAAAVMAAGAGCRNATPSSISSTHSVPAVQALPSAPSLEVSTKPLDPGTVEFTVRTNLPTPLSAMASLDLQGQKDKETAIGTSHKVTLTGPMTVFVVKAINDDDGMDGKALPDGYYDADVMIGPKWEENKTIASYPSKFEAKQTIQLHSSRSRASVEHQNELQKWVIDNLPSDAPWNEGKFKSRLGPYEKSASSLSPMHDAYYFPDADMTLIVNKVQQQVTIWRVGHASK
jgi:hypothetical protein